MILNGVLCLIRTESIYTWLPYISGLLLLARGIYRMVTIYRDRYYGEQKTSDFTGGMICILIGIGILLNQSEALHVIGVFWGIFSLQKSAGQIQELWACRKAGKRSWSRCLLLVVEILVGTTLAMMLIFDPYTKTFHHIMILGVELIFEGVLDIFHRGMQKVKPVRRKSNIL